MGSGHGRSCPSRYRWRIFHRSRPLGPGWEKTAEPATYLKSISDRGHSLVLMATTRPSGITAEDIRAAGGAVDRIVRLLSRFMEQSWKVHSRGVEQGRFEKLETVNDSGRQYDIGKTFCAYSFIRLLDRGAIVDGTPTQMRFVAYSCIDFLGVVAAQVSYSERGREQDLSDEVMAEGERWARSLRLGP